MRFYRWLVEIGLHPNKSKSLGSLKIPDAYFWDFLRGHLDGDGTLKVYNDPHYPQAQRLYVTFHSASQEHVTWLRGSISRLSDVCGYIDEGVRVWRLNYAKTEALIVLSHMYHASDVPCLQRKRGLIEKFL